MLYLPTGGSRATAAARAAIFGEACEAASAAQCPWVFGGDFNDDEKRQRDLDRRAWQRFLDRVDDDIAREPQRIVDFYAVASYRIEPVGIAYLWPVTN